MLSRAYNADFVSLIDMPLWEWVELMPLAVEEAENIARKAKK